MRYSILGAFITTTILLIGSVLVIIGAVKRLITPETINYDGMIWFAILGVVINFIAAYYTREGDSLNQKAVNLHMLEDVLGWVVVLIGSILMKFTDISFIDSLMSIGVSSYILFHAIHHFKEGIDLFLEKIPKDSSVEEIKHYLMEIPGVLEVHHIHLWTLDGNNNYATLHIQTNQKDTQKLKHDIREELKEHQIEHVTIEIETENENCEYQECTFSEAKQAHHHHH